MEASATTFDDTSTHPSAEPDLTADFGASACPMLGLRSTRLLRRLKPGQTAVITTDIGGSGRSLWRAALMTRTRIVGSYERDDRLHTVFRKG